MNFKMFFDAQNPTAKVGFCDYFFRFNMAWTIWSIIRWSIGALEGFFGTE